MKCSDFELVYSKQYGFVRKPIGPPSNPAGNEVVVQPKYVGICGSDMYFMETYDGELRLGHEWVGIVTAKGPNVHNLKIGDIVTSAGTLGCLDCKHCQTDKTNLCNGSISLSSNKLGALRSWMIIDEGHLVKLPGRLSIAMAIHEVIAVAEEAIRLMKSNLDGAGDKNVLILGGGPVGLAIARVISGDSVFQPVVVEKQPFRLDIARKMGFKAVSLSQALVDQRFANQFSIIIDATSDYADDVGAFKYIPTFAEKEFLAIIVGKYVRPPEIPRKIFGMAAKLIWMRGVPLSVLRQSVIKWNPLIHELADVLITNQYSIDEVTDAFDLVFKKSLSMKVIIEM